MLRRASDLDEIFGTTYKWKSDLLKTTWEPAFEWEDNIKIGLKEISQKCVELNHPTQKGQLMGSCRYGDKQLQAGNFSNSLLERLLIS